MSIVVAVARWLLVPVSMAAVAALVIFGGRWVVASADGRCASENLIGGACVEPWQTGFVEVVIYVSAAGLGLGLSLIPSAVAPALKRSVAVLGGLLALAPMAFIYVALSWSELFGPMFVAAVTGLCGIGWVWSRRTPLEDSA